MRLLLINPNVAEAIAERMAAEARAAASAGVEIVTATAAFGAQDVENRVEAAISAHAVLELLADRLPVPALDGVACAVRLAEALAGLGRKKATRGSFAAPSPKPTAGLSPALARAFE